MNRQQLKLRGRGLLGLRRSLVLGTLVLAGCVLGSGPPWRTVTLAAEAEGDPQPKSELSVDLEIFHGQFGSAVPEADEKSKGATTVANKNDTDGDGTVDNVDSVVKTTPTTLTSAAGQGITTLHLGSVEHFSVGTTIMIEKALPEGPPQWEVARIRMFYPGGTTVRLRTPLTMDHAAGDKVYKPEVDLMKLVLHKPSADLEGTVTLSKVKGDIKVWERPTKETEVPLTPPAQYTVAQLPKTLWVEATEVSTKLQSIELRMEYQGVPNTVKATAAWCEKTTRPDNEGKNPWLKRQAADGWPDNPKLGAGGQLPNLDSTDLVPFINDKLIAVDGARYGFGAYNKYQGNDTAIGGRELYEFRLLPANVETLGVKVDCTRQAWATTWAIAIGDRTPQPVPGFTLKWPWDEVPPRDEEEPNDDAPDAAQDNEPLNQLVYSFDAPGNSLSADANGFKVFRMSLKEWVRVKLQNQPFASLNEPEGSRASDKSDWHFVMYVKRNAAGKFEKDESAKDPSACAPTSHENGSLSVTVDTANCDTEGWKVTYSGSGNAWDVEDAGGRIRGTLFLVPNSNPREWSGTGRVDGNVWVTMRVTEGAGKTFADGDRFLFSTFKSRDATTGKQNGIGTGAFEVDGQNGAVP